MANIINFACFFFFIIGLKEAFTQMLIDREQPNVVYLRIPKKAVCEKSQPDSADYAGDFGPPDSGIIFESHKDFIKSNRHMFRPNTHTRGKSFRTLVAEEYNKLVNEQPKTGLEGSLEDYSEGSYSYEDNDYSGESGKVRKGFRSFGTSTWSEWNEWTLCLKECSGFRRRFRKCVKGSCAIPFLEQEQQCWSRSKCE